MNHDDHKNTHNALSPELEARLVAWIAGEASAFEAAELERLVTANPELAIFKRRIEAVHGLVLEAVRPERDSMRLSLERRTNLLQTLETTEKACAGSVAVFTARERRALRRMRWLRAMSLAACVVLGVGIFGLMNRSARKEAGVAKEAKLEASKWELEVRRKEAFEAKKRAAEAAVVSQEKRKAEPVQREVEAEAKRDADARRLARVQIEAAPRRQSLPSAVDLPVGPSVLGTPAVVPVPAVKWSSGMSGDEDKNVLSGSLASVSNNTRTETQGQSIYKGGGGADFDFRSSYVFGDKDKVGSPVAYGSADAERTRGFSPALAKEAAKSTDDGLSLDSFVVAGSQSAGAASGSAATRPEVKTEGAAEALEKVNADDRGIGLNESQPPALPAAPKSKELSVAGKKSAETDASRQPVSTFSLHVSDVSFRLAWEALAGGASVERERIRPEEFYNAFDYGDPSPAMSQKISCRIEQSAHPLLQQRNLVRIAMKVAAAGRSLGQPLQLTVLLDTSGSMEREDRANAVRAALKSLVSLLGPNDHVTLIGFARQPRLLADNISGDRAGQLLDMVARTPSEGGTNLEEALRLGRELARRRFLAAAQNRIVLLTDGAANLGNVDGTQLADKIEAMRQEGIALDVCGVGLDGIDDAMLEALTRRSDGRYYVLNSAEEADEGFARQLAGALRPAAKNVKVQVRFNPARVRSYRLIGFEQHRLREEDFRDDKVAAAELAAEEAAVALYQVEPLPQGDGELGEVFVRFLDPSTNSMVERSWVLPYDAKAPAFDRATATMQLAGTAALIAEALQSGAQEDAADLGELIQIVHSLPGKFPHEARVQKLVLMFDQIRRLTK